MAVRNKNYYPLLIAENWNRRSAKDNSLTQYSFFGVSNDTGKNILHYLSEEGLLNVISLVLNQAPALTIQQDSSLNLALECGSIRNQASWKLVFSMTKFMTIFMLQNAAISKLKETSNQNLNMDPGIAGLTQMPRIATAESLKGKNSVRGSAMLDVEQRQKQLLTSCKPENIGSVVAFFEIARRYPSVRLKLALLESLVSRLQSLQAKIDGTIKANARQSVNIIRELSSKVSIILTHCDTEIGSHLKGFLLPSLQKSINELRDILLSSLDPCYSALMAELCFICSVSPLIFDHSMTQEITTLLRRTSSDYYGHTFSPKLLFDSLAISLN